MPLYLIYSNTTKQAFTHPLYSSGRSALITLNSEGNVGKQTISKESPTNVFSPHSPAQLPLEHPAHHAGTNRTGLPCRSHTTHRTAERKAAALTELQQPLILGITFFKQCKTQTKVSPQPPHGSSAVSSPTQLVRAAHLDGHREHYTACRVNFLLLVLPTQPHQHAHLHSLKALPALLPTT